MNKPTTSLSKSKVPEKKKTTQKLYVGLDVHKDSVAVCVLPEAGGPVSEKNLLHDLKALRRHFDQLRDEHQAVLVMAYEAGVCGYALCRKIREWGYECNVLAPSRMPKAGGDKKRKTDRRDAYSIARALRAEELTFVRVPDAEDEAVRDVVRLRRQVKKDLARHRHHLGKFLLRKGRKYSGTSWRKPHEKWLAAQEFSTASERMVFNTCREEIAADSKRLVEIDMEIKKLSEQPRYAPAVTVCRAFRGIEVLTAMVLILELGDFRRFPNAPELMSFLGMTASEFTSSNTPRRGRITKAGNSYCRHVLIQAAWQYRKALRATMAVTKRREGLPEWLVANAKKADKRLTQRFLALTERIPSQKAVVAIARELSGFLWASMVELENATATEKVTAVAQAA
jgi:transposase